MLSTLVAQADEDATIEVTIVIVAVEADEAVSTSKHPYLIIYFSMTC